MYKLHLGISEIFNQCICGIDGSQTQISRQLEFNFFAWSL